MPAKYKATKLQIQQVKELFNKGLGARKIGKQLSLTRYQVLSIYKTAGISNAGRTQVRVNHLLTEKVCKRCKELKPIEQFRSHKRASTLGDYTILIEPYCKPCEKEKVVEYRENNREAINKRTNEWHKNNRDKINERDRDKYNSDPAYKLRKRVSSQIRQALSKNSSAKFNQSCKQYLTYSFEELKIHLESLFEYWMTWDNYGVYDTKTWNDNDQSTWRWNIDHIIPQSDLPYTSMEDDNFKLCWALSNLRPLSAKQNLIDGARATRHKDTE